MKAADTMQLEEEWFCPGIGEWGGAWVRWEASNDARGERVYLSDYFGVTEVSTFQFGDSFSGEITCRDPRP